MKKKVNCGSGNNLHHLLKEFLFSELKKRVLSPFFCAIVL
jgi:hypothetical protein